MPGKDVRKRRTTSSRLAAAVGAAVGECVAELAPERGEVGLERLCAAAGRAARRHAAGTGVRVGAWQVASLAGVGLRLAPPLTWSFVGGELLAGGGRVDVVWQDRRGRRLVDEVKTAGFGRVLEDADVVAQVDRYRRWGLQQWEQQFLGVRVLALAGPLRSRFWPPAGPSRPLVDTEWWFGFGEQLAAGGFGQLGWALDGEGAP